MFRRKDASQAAAPGSKSPSNKKLVQMKDYLKKNLSDLEPRATRWEAPNAELEQLTKQEREIESQRARALSEIQKIQKSHQNLVNSAHKAGNEQAAMFEMEEQTRRYNELMDEAEMLGRRKAELSASRAEFAANHERRKQMEEMEELTRKKRELDELKALAAAKTPKFTTDLPFSSPYNSYPMSSSASVDPFAGLGGETPHPPNSNGHGQSWLYPGGFARTSTAPGQHGMPPKHTNSATGFRNNGGQPHGRANSMNFPPSHPTTRPDSANDDPFGLRGSFGHWNEKQNGPQSSNFQHQQQFRQQQQHPQQSSMNNNFAQPYNRSRTVSESSIPFDLAMDDSAMQFDNLPPMGSNGLQANRGMNQQGSRNFSQPNPQPVQSNLNQHNQFHTPAPGPPMSYYPPLGQDDQANSAQLFYQAGPLQGQRNQQSSNHQQFMQQPSMNQMNQNQSQQAQRSFSHPNLGQYYDQHQQNPSRPPSQQAQQRQQRMRAGSAAGQNHSPAVSQAQNSMSHLSDSDLLLLLDDPAILQGVLSKLTNIEREALIGRLEKMKDLSTQQNNASHNQAQGSAAGPQRYHVGNAKPYDYTASSSNQNQSQQQGQRVAFAEPPSPAQSSKGIFGPPHGQFNQAPQTLHPPAPPNMTTQSQQNHFDQHEGTLYGSQMNESQQQGPAPYTGSDFEIVKRGQPSNRNVVRVIDVLEEFPEENDPTQPPGDPRVKTSRQLMTIVKRARQMGANGLDDLYTEELLDEPDAFVVVAKAVQFG